jgi:hypothetical protein
MHLGPGIEREEIATCGYGVELPSHEMRDGAGKFHLGFGFAGATTATTALRLSAFNRGCVVHRACLLLVACGAARP